MPTTFSRRPILWTSLLLLLFLLFAVTLVAAGVLRAQRITGQQTVLVAPNQLAPGQQAVLRAVVHDFTTGQPLAGADVIAFLRPSAQGDEIQVFQGQTGPTGSAEIRFSVPEDLAGAQQVVLRTNSKVGSDELSQPVTVQRNAKLLLTSDKPLYQPGQIIHLRALALDAGTLAALADQPLEFVVEDPKGNKVFKEGRATSDFGIAGADFRLADQVNTGSYRILAQLVGEGSGQEGVQSEKRVTVRPYTLPKFQITLQTDRPWYLPGQRVQGSLQAGYFFGKPVSEGQVTIAGSIYQVERQQVLELAGTTDADGRFQFEFDLPDYFVSGAPEVGQAAFGLEATVIDQANQAEQVAQTLLVAQQPLLIDVVAESGRLKPGLENIVYLLTSYPNGAPAQTQIDITASDLRQSLTTGSAGLAELRYTPPASIGPIPLQIVARDEQGNESRIVWGLETDVTQETLLLRPERAAYRVGDTLHVDILASQPAGTAYLDIIRAGQTISTRALEIANGRASADIDLDETLFGTLELHAYKVLRDASLVADTRLVVVDRAGAIDIAVEADRETYRPGDPATISFMTSKDGRPLPAALGLSIVDESVFALQEQEAGFARLYFLLQAEILEPKYQIKGFSPDWLLAPEPGQPTELQAAQDRSARAALAANPMPEPIGLSLPRYDKQQAIRTERNAIFQLPLNALLGGMALLGLAGLAISLVALRRRGEMLKSLPWALGGLVVSTLIVGLPIVLLVNGWSDNAPLLLGGPALLALVIGVVGLVVHAWRAEDRGLQAVFLLWAALLALLLLLFYLSFWTDLFRVIDEATLLWGLVGTVALLLALYLRGAGFLATGQRGPGLLGMLAGLGLPVLLAGGVLTIVPFGAMAPQAAFDMAVPAAMQPPMEVEVRQEVEVVPAPDSAEEGPAAGQEPPRLRQFFPETLYWNPEVITDDSGRAMVQLESVADSITTWRMSVLASSQHGELGNTTAGLRVFQDFFVDLDLPLYLTQNDEVSLPVAVFNYLPDAQEVRLEVEPQDWFELLDEAEKTLVIQSNDVEVVYFRIRAAQFGRQPFQVTAWGQFMSDAIVKEVQVVPDGKRFRDTQSDRLQAGETVLTLPVPEGYVPGTGQVFVKIYPGVVSQVVEGLQGMLRMPFG